MKLYINPEGITMEKKSYKINIVGGGISGLIAAQVLENNGYEPLIYEATDRVGGRLKTDIVDGYQLDHGFQVLLKAYPKTQEYLDYNALELQELLPGAVVYKNGKTQTLGDPSRSLSFLGPTIAAGIGTISDKFKILKLNLKLSKKSFKEIFNDTETTTLAYLQKFPFSEGMINGFFRPFFSGIFLEPDLTTSSRMFEFTFKLFGQDNAAIPKAGIAAIPQQLQSKLKNTHFVYNTKVKSVGDDKLALENGSGIKSDFTIIATEANELVSNLKNQTTPWKSCDNLYFLAEKRKIEKPIIGLLTDKDALVNNLFYHTSVETNRHGNKELLSTTVVKDHNLNSDALIKQVQEELRNYCGIVELEFLKHYHIKRGLPDLKNIHYELAPTETQLKDTIFLAGDQMLNGSLNAAMISGERAALGVIQKIEGGTIV